MAIAENITMSWTTFLTMALATERYLAVCWPISYRTLGELSDNFCKLKFLLFLITEVSYSSTWRVLAYILPSFLSSIVLNIPKFLEAQLETFTYMQDNETHHHLIYNVTSLRLNQDYMYYYIHWTRYSWFTQFNLY